MCIYKRKPVLFRRLDDSVQKNHGDIDRADAAIHAHQLQIRGYPRQHWQPADPVRDFRRKPDSADQLLVVEQRKAAANGHQFLDVCGKRRFTFLPTSISRSQATDHGRDA